MKMGKTGRNEGWNHERVITKISPICVGINHVAKLQKKNETSKFSRYFLPYKPIKMLNFNGKFAYLKNYQYLCRLKNIRL